MQPNIILASSSKARLALMENIGITPQLVISPDADETPLPNELPRHYCIRVAEKKFAAALDMLKASHKGLLKHAIVITADTTVACGRRMLHKSFDRDEIKRHLQLLSGRRHKALTGFVCGLIKNGELKTLRKRTVESVLKFKRFQNHELKLLLDSGQCEGKAGGYTLNGLASRYLEFIRGSHSNVIGLPLYEVTQTLCSLGYK